MMALRIACISIKGPNGMTSPPMERGIAYRWRPTSSNISPSLLRCCSLVLAACLCFVAGHSRLASSPIMEICRPSLAPAETIEPGEAERFKVLRWARGLFVDVFHLPGVEGV